MGVVDRHWQLVVERHRHRRRSPACACKRCCPMDTFTNVTVLHAADNLLARLKVVDEASIGHANQFQGARTQLVNMRALQARLSGPPSSIRVKTMEMAASNMDQAIQSMHEDLREMQMILEQLQILPTSNLALVMKELTVKHAQQVNDARNCRAREDDHDLMKR